VIGIITLGTPFGGSEAAISAIFRANIARKFHSAAHTALLEDIHRSNNSLDELVFEFARLVHDREGGIELLCCYEREETNISKALLPKKLAELFSVNYMVRNNQV
jgi:hypothetical protein